MAREAYPTDPTEDECRVLGLLIRAAKPGGHPRGVDVREVVNAIRCLLRSGGARRLLPHEFPPWPTAHAYVRRWQAAGTWARVAGALRRDLRAARGRAPEPSAAVVDSQTVETTETSGPRAFEAGKRTTGRKRHFLVDPESFLTASAVHPANFTEGAGGWRVLAKAHAAGIRLAKVWVDGGDQDGFAQ